MYKSIVYVCVCMCGVVGEIRNFLNCPISCPIFAFCTEHFSTGKDRENPNIRERERERERRVNKKDKIDRRREGGRGK